MHDVLDAGALQRGGQRSAVERFVGAAEGGGEDEERGGLEGAEVGLLIRGEGEGGEGAGEEAGEVGAGVGGVARWGVSFVDIYMYIYLCG